MLLTTIKHLDRAVRCMYQLKQNGLALHVGVRKSAEDRLKILRTLSRCVILENINAPRLDSQRLFGKRARAAPDQT